MLELPDIPLLTDTERSCVRRYVELLVETVGGLVAVCLYGSVARGESWPAGMPIHSDVDLLVVTDDPLEASEVERLLDATMPLFLECGRQIGPQFRTAAQLAGASDARSAAFLENVRRDAVVLWSRGSPSS